MFSFVLLKPASFLTRSIVVYVNFALRFGFLLRQQRAATITIKCFNILVVLCVIRRPSRHRLVSPLSYGNVEMESITRAVITERDVHVHKDESDSVL